MIISRFAPAPTGLLHLGHIVNALHVWGIIQAAGGRVLLRPGTGAMPADARALLRADAVQLRDELAAKQRKPRASVETRAHLAESLATLDDALRAAGRRWVPGAHGLDPLLEYLEGQGVLDGRSLSAAPVEVLAERYRRWLVADRGLAEATVVRYVKLARSFLNQHLTGRGGLESLSGADIVAFLLAESQRLSVGSVKGRVGELRSLLRFLYLQGLTPRPMAAAVPPVAGWRDTGVPKAIPAGDVQRLLDSCDRQNPVGIRDYAILMLVARLGRARSAQSLAS